jgi:hypothetical protein
MNTKEVRMGQSCTSRVVTWLSVLILVTNGPALFACSAVFVDAGTSYYFANNEDWHDPDAYLGFYPATNRDHGRLLFEFDWPIPPVPHHMTDFAGINDQGLFFDRFSVVDKPVTATGSRPWLRIESITRYCIRTCSTVQDVLDVYAGHDLSFMNDHQSFYGDRSGDSAIVEGHAVVRGDGRYQICTNFRQSEFVDRPIYDDRFVIMEREINRAGQITPAFLAEHVLSAVANHSPDSPTQYSYVYDTVSADLHIYYFHNYQESIVFNVNEELEKGRRTYHLPSLFAYVTTALPRDRATVDGPQVTFSWKGAPTEYRLFCSPDPGLDGVEPIIVRSADPVQDSRQVAGIGVAAVVAAAGAGMFSALRRRRWPLVVVAAMLLVACAGIPQRQPQPRDLVQDYSCSIDGFRPGVVYYWSLETEREPGFVCTFDGGSFRVAGQDQ